MTVSTKKSDASWTSSLSQDNAASYECRTTDTCMSPTADTRSYLTPFIFTKDALTDNSQTTLIKTSTSFIRVTSDGACFVPGAWMSGLNLTSNSEIRKKPHVSQILQNIKTHEVKSSLRNSLKFKTINRQCTVAIDKNSYLRHMQTTDPRLVL